MTRAGKQRRAYEQKEIRSELDRSCIGHPGALTTRPGRIRGKKDV